MARKLGIIFLLLVSIMGIICGLSIIELLKVFIISLGIYTPISIIKKKIKTPITNKEENKSNKIEFNKNEEKEVSNNILRIPFNEQLQKDKVLVKTKKKSN